jgi:hypothetical protein
MARYFAEPHANTGVVNRQMYSLASAAFSASLEVVTGIACPRSGKAIRECSGCFSATPKGSTIGTNRSPFHGPAAFPATFGSWTPMKVELSGSAAIACKMPRDLEVVTGWPKPSRAVIVAAGRDDWTLSSSGNH